MNNFNSDNHDADSNEITFDHYLDTQGLKCPEPIMLLHRAIRKAEATQVIKMVATDPTTMHDITNFCSHLGHQLLQEHTTKNSDDSMVYSYWIQKKV